MPSSKWMEGSTSSPREFSGGQGEVSEIKKAPLRLKYGPCKAINQATLAIYILVVMVYMGPDVHENAGKGGLDVPRTRLQGSR